MSSPSRFVRFLFAFFGYSGVQWTSGRWVRALVWDALLIAYLVLIFHLPMWIVGALVLGQAIDAAILEPRADHSDGTYAVVGLISFVGLIAVSLVTRATWVEAFKIPSGGMLPTLNVGDHIFVDKTAKHPRRGDVTVFKYPKEPDKDFVKRVVAVGGDTIEIRDNVLVINGAPVPHVHVDGPCEYQDYNDETRRWETRACDAFDETLDGHTYRVFQEPDAGVRSWPPLKVPADSYFAMGDNRDNSADSRFWGFVPQDHIKGVARKIWFSEGPRGVRVERLEMPVR
jgi:signal peptidase I